MSRIVHVHGGEVKMALTTRQIQMTYSYGFLLSPLQDVLLQMKKTAATSPQLEPLSLGLVSFIGSSACLYMNKGSSLPFFTHNAQ